VEEQKAAEPDMVSNIMDGISGIDLEEDLDNVPDCICGSKMVVQNGRSAYGRYSAVYCDGCSQRCLDGKVYHCPNGKDAVHHPNGYDLCPKCGDEKVAKDLGEEEWLLALAEAEAEAEARNVVDEQESPVVVEVKEPVVDDFVYADQLAQIKNIMALHSGDQDEHIKTLLVQHKGDISRVVPLLLD